MLRDDHDHSNDVVEDSTLSDENASNGTIICRVCESELSSQDQVIVMTTSGATQAFANPAGLLREVLTLGQAWNLRLESESTIDFTWYPGYAWRICYCDHCHSHLGWRYEAADARQPAQFYGLLLKAIRQA